MFMFDLTLYFENDFFKLRFRPGLLSRGGFFKEQFAPA
jgi:hypothetical protein